MGQGDVPGLTRKSRPAHLPGRNKNMASLFGGKGGGASKPRFRTLVCVLALIFLHIEVQNIVELQFVIQPADPP